MHPVVNIEDPVGKVVGKRATPTPRAYLDQAFGLQKTLREFPRQKIPRSVFRFKTHEEADQWLIDHLTRKPAN